MKEVQWARAAEWKDFRILQKECDGIMIKVLEAVDKWTEFQQTKLRKGDKRSRWMQFYDRLAEDGSLAFYREAPPSGPAIVIN